MSEYSPPNPYIIIPFDSLYYDVNSNASITLAYANATYYKKTGGIVNGFILATESITTQNNLVVPLGKFTIGSTLVTSSALQLNYNDITTIGISEASKALIVDSSRNISNINIINGEQMKLTTFLNNTIAINSFSNTQVNNSSMIGTYDFYIKKNTAQVGDSCSIGFTATANDINTTPPMASIIANRVSFQVGTLSFNTTQVERLKISETGIISLSNTTDSSSSTAGALTIAGGLAIAKKLYIGTNLSVAGNSTLTALSLTDITLNGNLTMSNITSNLTISGANSSLNLTGSSTIITISNTSQSTSSITGSIQNAGGIYCGANSRFGGNISCLGSLLQTGAIIMQSTSGINLNSNSLTNCTTFTISGIQTSTNTSVSTLFSNGALLLAGGIGISNSTDAISSTNGGTFTTAGGMAIAKKLYVGSDLYIGGNLLITGSTTGIVNAQITDTGISTLVNPLTITHLLSSGTPTANSFRMGMLFNGPNASNTTVNYGRIYSTAQVTTAGLHQGSLTFSSVIGGALVDVMTISSLASSTNNSVSIAGATSVLGVYNISATIGTFSSNLTISKSTSPNLTIASTNSSTQSQLIFTTDNQTWEMGSRGSTAGLYPTNFYIYNTQMNMVMSPAGITKYLNTTDSSTSSNGAFIISGGVGIAKKLNIGSDLYISGITTSVGAIGCNNYYYSNLTASANYIGNWNWTNYWGLGGDALSNTVKLGICSISGVFTGTYANLKCSDLISASTTDSTSTSTGSITSLGGISCAKTIWCNKTVLKAENGHLKFERTSDALNYTTINANSASDGSLNCIMQFSNTNWSTVFTFGIQGTSTQQGGRLSLSNGGIRDGHTFDCGVTHRANQICIQQTNNLVGTNQIGSSTTAMTYTSAMSGGHKFYSNTTTGVSAPAVLGNLIGEITAEGDIKSVRQLISPNNGVHSYGFNSSGLSSYAGGVHMHWNGSKGEVFAYDYSAGTYQDLTLGNGVLNIKASNSFVGIGALTPGYPLTINSTVSGSIAGAYGYLSSGGAGAGVGTGSVSVSLYCANGRIMCPEIDCFSDKRIKTDVRDISNLEANVFLNTVKPVNYTLIEGNVKAYGYIAQDIMKAGSTINSSIKYKKHLFEDLIELHETDKEVSEDIDEDGFISPANMIYTVSYLKIIPILHKALLMSNELIKKNQELIESLRKELKVESERIDEIIDVINEDYSD